MTHIQKELDKRAKRTVNRTKQLYIEHKRFVFSPIHPNIKCCDIACMALEIKIILSNHTLIWSFNIEKKNRWRNNKRIKEIETNLLHQGGYGVV